MPASSLELVPRGSVSILDAAIRVCARQSGPWALTLPSSVAVTAAVLWLADAIAHRGPILWPSLAVALAWVARAVGQAAAAQHVQDLVLGAPEGGVPRALSAYRLALRHLPSVLIAAGLVLGFNALLLSGIGLILVFFFNPALLYAVALRGRGHPLALFATQQTLLGPTRSTAVLTRLLFGAQWLLYLNIHLAALTLTFLGTSLMGLDLVFVERFQSLENPVWLVLVVAVGFTLLEPLRAAVAGCLLVDARVRQEGLGLLARVDQLPRRHVTSALPGTSAAMVAVLALALLAPGRASAGELEAQRLSGLMTYCHRHGPVAARALRNAAALRGEDAAACQRFVLTLQSELDSPDDCPDLEARLTLGLQQLANLDLDSLDPAPVSLDEKVSRETRRHAEAARARAREILAQPEFYVPAQKANATDAEPHESWLSRMLHRLWLWLLRQLKNRDEKEPEPMPSMGGGLLVARGLAWAMGAVAVVVVLYLVVSALQRRRRAKQGGSELTVGELDEVAGPLTEDALARPADAWARHADSLAAKGSFLAALRNLYLAVLAQLHREGAIDYRVTSSNWDYVSRYRGIAEERDALRGLTLRFDVSIYGRQLTGEAEYLAFRDLAAPVLRRSLDAQVEDAAHA